MIIQINRNETQCSYGKRSRVFMPEDATQITNDIMNEYFDEDEQPLVIEGLSVKDLYNVFMNHRLDQGDRLIYNEEHEMYHLVDVIYEAMVKLIDIEPFTKDYDDTSYGEYSCDIID